MSDSSATVNSDLLISHTLFGRRKIFSSVKEVDASNVLDVLNKAYLVHLQNRSEINYLYDYYKGKQPIIDRVKEFRPNIINNVIVNRANEIVAFKVGYQCGNPMQYTAAKSDDGISDKIENLNNLMAYENKAMKDKELVEWQMICGTAYRSALPDATQNSEEDEAPFSIDNLRPNQTFVVYSDKIGERSLASVTYWADGEYTGELNQNQPDGILYGNVFAIYTPKYYFEIKGGKIVTAAANNLGIIPIIEYPANSARLGAFEIVIDLLNALSLAESNRLDGLEQFVQSFIKFVNCDIDPEKYEEFLAMGAIKVFSHEGKNADVSIVSSELNQDQTQTLVNDIYDTILTICGMPNRNGGSSTSDTGAAVQLRDGWSSAEARAKESEIMFEASERELLKVVLHMLRDKGVLDLKVSDIQMVFPRRNYENVQGKVAALTTMLGCELIDPNDAYAASGLFTDPERAAANGLKWYKEQLDKFTVENVGDEDKDVSGSGQPTDEDTQLS